MRSVNEVVAPWRMRIAVAVKQTNREELTMEECDRILAGQLSDQVALDCVEVEVRACGGGGVGVGVGLCEYSYSEAANAAPANVGFFVPQPARSGVSIRQETGAQGSIANHDPSVMTERRKGMQRRARYSRSSSR